MVAWQLVSCKNENQKRVQDSNIGSKTSRNKKHQAAKNKKIEPTTCQRNRVVLLPKMKSREPAAHQANKQTVSKKKTKGYGSAKCITNTLHVVQNIYALVVTSCATSAL